MRMFSNFGAMDKSNTTKDKSNDNLNVSVDKAIDEVRQYILSKMDIPTSLRDVINKSSEGSSHSAVISK